MECQDGYIGMGICGSDFKSVCTLPQKPQSWTNLQCCKIESRTSLKSSCVERYGSNGERNACEIGKMVFQLCGSGGNRDCVRTDDQTKFATKIQCCYDNALRIDNNKCVWKYGAAGSDITCEKGYVLTGVCGQTSSEKCPGDNGHGVFCCHLK